jgi:ferric-dicitrate binding protein FerR (iron transport regulator)
MSTHEDPAPDDAEIAELLRSVGPRSEPAPEIAREIESAVRAEWEQTVAARKRRRAFTWAAAAAMCALAIAVTIGLSLWNLQGQPVAVLQRADGEIFVAADGRQWAPLTAGREIAVGDQVRSNAHAAFALKNGLALRIDRGTVLRVAAPDRVALNVGAVYVDAPPGQADRELTVETHLGSVRHLGTQYQVRATAEGIDVGVREGRVVIDSAAGSNTAAAGERVQISTRGTIQRSTLSPVDAQWQWAIAAAPAFTIDDQPLATFLTWIARETGRTLVYASPRAEAAAAEITLHGSIEGLAPDAALAAVLATTPLRNDATDDTAIEIELAPSIDRTQGARPTP